ncbi:MAG: RNA polymerase sigma factor [Verrucomicrobia bacterium]|nr:RNA polymerase sigma factor [Verrucomicrobiota bacterium]
MPIDDVSELLGRLRKGDQSAAQTLVAQLYPLVLKIVRNHLPRREMEEDLCQEVFLKIFSKVHQFRSDVPFTHWVSRIAVNTCIDHLRKQKNRPEFRWSDFSEEQQAIFDNLREGATLPPERSPGEVRELLHRVMAGLRPDERLVIELMYLEEKSIAEISNLTGWKTSKIKVTAFRARQKLLAAIERIEK